MWLLYWSTFRPTCYECADDWLTLSAKCSESARSTPCLLNVWALPVKRLALVQMWQHNTRRHLEFCVNMTDLTAEAEAEAFVEKICFNSEATFVFSENVDLYNTHVRSPKRPHAVFQHVRGSPSINVFLFLLWRSVRTFVVLRKNGWRNYLLRRVGVLVDALATWKQTRCRF